MATDTSVCTVCPHTRGSPSCFACYAVYGLHKTALQPEQPPSAEEQSWEAWLAQANDLATADATQPDYNHPGMSAVKLGSAMHAAIAREFLGLKPDPTPVRTFASELHAKILQRERARQLALWDSRPIGRSAAPHDGPERTTTGPIQAGWADEFMRRWADLAGSSSRVITHSDFGRAMGFPPYSRGDHQQCAGRIVRTAPRDRQVDHYLDPDLVTVTTWVYDDVRYVQLETAADGGIVMAAQHGEDPTDLDQLSGSVALRNPDDTPSGKGTLLARERLDQQGHGPAAVFMMLQRLTASLRRSERRVANGGRRAPWLGPQRRKGFRLAASKAAQAVKKVELAVARAAAKEAADVAEAAKVAKAAVAVPGVVAEYTILGRKPTGDVPAIFHGVVRGNFNTDRLPVYFNVAEDGRVQAVARNSAADGVIIRPECGDDPTAFVGGIHVDALSRIVKWRPECVDAIIHDNSPGQKYSIDLSSLGCAGPRWAAVSWNDVGCAHKLSCTPKTARKYAKKCGIVSHKIGRTVHLTKPQLAAIAESMGKSVPACATVGR